MPTTTDLDGIIAKIHKLKAMAEGGATQGEIDNATALIQKLMLEHNIEEAHLAIDAGEPLTGYGYSTIFDNVGASWRGVLIEAITRGHQCKAVRSVSRGTFQVFGHRDAVPVVLALYSELAAALEVMARQAYDRERSYDSARSWCNTYRMGAAHAIYARFDRQLAEAKRASERASTALVVINHRVDEAVAKVYPKLKDSKAARVRGSADAYHAGRAAGSAMSLERTAKLS
jgi:hypothetical protein